MIHEIQVAASIDMKAPADAAVPGVSDLIGTTFSLASNFWPYLLAGLALLLAPRLYTLAVAALSPKSADDSHWKEDYDDKDTWIKGVNYFDGRYVYSYEEADDEWARYTEEEWEELREKGQVD